MKLNGYSVLDSKAGFYGPPFFGQSDSGAIRDFGDAVNDASPQNMWSRHPEDFTLYKICEYDNLTGEIVPVRLEALVTASALRAVRRDVSKENELPLDFMKDIEFFKKEPVG